MEILQKNIAMVELVPLTEDAKDLESDEQYILLDGSEIEGIVGRRKRRRRSKCIT